MTNVINELKYRFGRKDILMRLIIINLCVFLVLAVVRVVTTLFKLDGFDFIGYLGVPSDPGVLITRPWTLFSYMFVHVEFLHILPNMLFLYWFGQIFLTYFSPKNLGSLYILGGLSGALIYILAFNFIPYYIDMGNMPMIGASASAIAVVFASAFYNPNMQVSLFFVWRVKIIYIAVAVFIIDFISLAGDTNPGGHVAHIGGALLGYIYARYYLKGTDITRWMTNLIDRGSNLFKPKPKLKIKYKRRETDYEYNRRKHSEIEEIDRILDKIKVSGYGSLSTDEKKKLFDAGKK